MFESGPFPASFSVAEIWSLSKKTEILQKREKVCQLAVGDMFCSSICEGQR